MAPFVASPMRQILAEAFEVGNAYLREVEDQYAALAPLPSATFEEPHLTSSSVENLKAEVETKLSSILDVKKEELTKPEPPVIFEKGDIVEILHGEQWHVGAVLQRNEDTGDGETYSVLWWVKDKSQRFGQRTPRHILREPQEVPVPPALYEYAAEAWRTAGSWALEPFRRLHSRSDGNVSSSSISSSTRTRQQTH